MATRKRTCGSLDHHVDRRAFLGTAAGAFVGGAYGLDAFAQPTLAGQVSRNQKRVLLIFLNGGLSQFESWDPKPGRPTGGPFQAIPTSIPGYHMSELMPKMASCIHRHTAVIRSQLATADHNDRLIFGGQPKAGPVAFPSLGAMVASELADPNSKVPHHVLLTNYLNVHNYFETAGILGATWNPINIKPDKVPPTPPFVMQQSKLRLVPPANKLPEGISDEDHREREALREQLNNKFGVGRARRRAAQP